MKPRRLLPFTAAITCVLTASAHAVERIKANNADALNLSTSWITAIPGSGDVAVWNNTVTAANVTVLGANTSWQGIKIVNPTGLVTINAGNTLTLGTAGIDIASTNAGLVISSAVTLGANQSFVIGNSSAAEDITFNSGSSGLAFNMGGFTVGTSGLGTMRFTSGYTIDNGIFNLDAASNQFQSGGGRTTTLNNNVTLNLFTGKTLVFGINSAPASGIAVNSAAAINITSGTLQINSSGTTGTTRLEQTGKVSFTGTSTVNNASAFAYFSNFSGEIALAGTTTWNESGSSTANTTISGPLTGNGVLNYRGTSSNHRTDLSGNNSLFAGTINLDGGSGSRNLRLTTANSGSGSATWSPSAGNILQVDGVAVNLGTLNGAGTVTNSHATNVAGITVRAGAFSGAITNGTPLLGMALTKTGSGTLALTGANTYTGLTDIQGGTLSTTTLQTGGGAVTVGDAGTFGLTQSANVSTFNISTLTLGSAGGSNLILTSATAPSVALITAPNFTVNGSSSITLKGTPVNNTTLIDYTGTIGGGGFGGLSLLLPFRTSGTLFHDTTNTLVQLTSFAADTLKWQGNVNSAWDIDTTNTGAPSGATANWKTNAAPGGAYYVQAGAGLVDSPVFDDTATGSTAVTLATTVTPVGITFNNSSLAYSVSGAGAIAGTTSIVKNGTAALTLATNNSFNGGVQLNAGTLNVNNNGALGTGTLTIAAGTTLNNTSGSAKVATNSQNWNGDFTFTGTNDLTLGTAAMNASRQVTVSAGTLAVGGITGSGFGLTKAGAGTLSVGASSYNGATAVNAGTLRATSTTSFTTTSSVTLANTAGVTLDLNGNSQTIGNLTGGGTTGGNVILGGATLTTGIATDTTIGGLSGAGGLVKNNAGRLFILGDKSGYTGTTSISGGTLDVGTLSGAFGTGNVVGSNTVFLQGNGSTTTGITGGASGFGARGGNLTINVGGAGAQILLNSAGNGGLGQMNFGSATSDSKVIVENGISINNFNGTRTFTVNPGTGTASAEITGVVANGAGNGDTGIAKAGTGDLILSNANTITGATSINAGRIVLGHNQALQFTSLDTGNAGSVSATGFTTPSIGGLTGSVALGSFISSGYSGITTLTLAPQTGRSLSYSGVIADGAVGMNLIKSGAGTQTLTNVQTYTGSTNIDGGTLQLDGSTHASSTVNIGTAGTLTGTGTVNGNATLTGNGIINKASGTIAGTLGVTGGNWNGAGTVSGAVTQTSGVFRIGTGANLTAASGLDVTGGTLTGAGAITGNTSIGSGAIHNAGGIGTVGSQAITGNLDYGTGSIFNWDLNANSTAGGFDTVSATGDINVGASTVFNVVFGTGVNLGDVFWSTASPTRDWSMASIFGKVFTSGSFASVTSTADPLTQGAFTITGSGSTLTWTAVPEPTSALAGLLLGAGLLRRRRK